MPLRMGDQTAGMVVMDGRLGAHGPLARFIAERRVPGRDWRSFEQIADEITDVTGLPLSGMGVQKWAERLGIPDSSREVTAAARDAYLSAAGKFLRARGERTA